ncbi:MAG TPA: DNA repair protein RadC [Edaphobacter sp.]|uniref:RadC family protein n=1 Tax=Edaphobacter sp. TaxID=1934404 RepID=UPI002D0F73A7|nr:DNA repair protein RadC [Edaphobacter sp.]HUZ94415.1 DNA repair protein RadC [Edaphobacter sp.]
MKQQKFNLDGFAQDSAGRYTTARPVTADELIVLAERILSERFARGKALSDPAAVKRWLVTRLADRPHEVFCVLHLDNRHRVIAFDELFRGTIDGASVHPREVVKQVLQHNSAAVIFVHNHPSGVSEPSDADRRLTQRLKDSLALVDVRTLDHFVVGGAEVVSFAERGWL